MPHKLNLYPGTVLESLAAAGRAARAIPPAWPLEATVAVNPLLGQAGEPLEVAAARLGRVAGVRLTMPRSWYAARVAAGEITEDDIAAALGTASATDAGDGPPDVAGVLAALQTESPAPEALPTLAHLAAEADGTDWPGIVADRIGVWAGGFFDAGQALWSAPVSRGAYAEWRAAAQHDLVPEILGLRGFATHVAEAPETAQDAIARAVTRLDIAPEMQESVFHRLLMDIGGWAQLARQRLWQADLEGRHEPIVTEFLAIRLVWEEALLQAHATAIGARWRDVCAAHAVPPRPTRAQVIDAVLQTAAERAAQRRLAAFLAAPRRADTAPAGEERPSLQAAFCIDVRSEPFRRALEGCAPGILTLGFAGFFGLAVAHRGAASDVVEARLPALLLAGQGSRAPLAAETDRLTRARARASRAWGRFKLAAVSSFAFVEAAGPLYVGRLLRDALGQRGPEGASGPAPVLDPLPPLDERVNTAARVLHAMGLTQGFARLVLLVGHGAGVVNNPHASALHCGACGGHSGEVNARLLAGLLNDPQVRAGLLAEGVEIPADTLFIAALHDTTADDVTLYDTDQPAPDHRAAIAEARRWLATAGAAARAERALRLPGARGAADVARRGRDWAQTRHEWGLAGCQAFIAAPRAVTLGRDLSGRAFLHDYDWRQDDGFGVLELILTAPVVVASWIALQYYGSVVAPDVFGAGDKTLHNVVGGVGVVEGSGGRLRVGLPWQSVHDGMQLVHEPLRLSVCIAAPPEAITQVLERHSAVRELFDNGWLHLFALGDEGRVARRYCPGGGWSREPSATGLPALAAE